MTTKGALVAYGTKDGATAGIAEQIGRTLREDGLEAVVLPADGHRGARLRAPAPAPRPLNPQRRNAMSHTGEWKTRVYLFEEDRTTKVRVELDTGTTKLTGHGTAHCNPADADVPEIGDELAAARAMEDLSAQLKRLAQGDMEAAETRP